MNLRSRVSEIPVIDYLKVRSNLEVNNTEKAIPILD
jgi:hypothetical protein